MKNENMTVAATTPSSHVAPAAQDNPPALVKKIGKMTYIVRIHFSETSTETMEDKIKRMLKNEVRQIMENECAGR